MLLNRNNFFSRLFVFLMQIDFTKKLFHHHFFVKSVIFYNYSVNFYVLGDKITLLYPHLHYSEQCYKGTALYIKIHDNAN